MHGNLYVRFGIHIAILAMISAPAFARNESASTCGSDPEFLRSVGSLQDVKSMMEIRLVDTAGNSSDPFVLATTYFRNARGRQDFERALYLFREAATSGDVEASFILGFMFAEGYGTRRNSCESEYWYCTAGARGIEEAKYAMRARCEHFGLGSVSD